jgi:predicted nucleotidyltransferase component of viral defense system
MKPDIKNLEASVRGRLQNKAKETSRPFSEVLQYYGMERFLYRLSQSEYSETFVLKGALMFTVWDVKDRRTTVDIDFLAQHDNRVNEIERVVKDICKMKVTLDGLAFDSESAKGQKIKEDADYEGVRVKFMGYLERSRIPMQIDFGFGDVIHPSAKKIKFPALLNFPVPELYGYTAESVIAEKFEAMIKLGILNSRMKDFYDVWIMTRQFDFEGKALVQAIQKTFKKRKTGLPESMPFFPAQIYDKASMNNARWKAFLATEQLEHAPAELADVAKSIERFLQAPLEAIRTGAAFTKAWHAPGQWK